MTSKTLAQLIALALLAAAAPLFAESAQSEVDGRWLLSPSTQNWSCFVVAGKQPVTGGTGVGACYAGFREHLGFVKAFPLRQTTATGDRYYFYVQEWGALEGPGSECWGDSILIFDLPYTSGGAQSLMAKGGPIYRGAAQPANSCPENVGGAANPERSHWSFHSVFHDTIFGGGTYMLGQRVRDSGFSEIWLGESKGTPPYFHDRGLHFNWRRLTYTNNLQNSNPWDDLEIYGIYAIPVTGTGIWRGYLYVAHPGGQGASPVIIDWNTLQIRYWSGYDQWTNTPVWTTVRMYDEPITTLPYIRHHGFLTSFTYVRGRYEMWFDQPVPRSGNRPLATCPDDPYLINNARWQGGGQAPYYVVVDSNFNVLTPPRSLTSSLHPIPSDTGFSVGELTRIDTLAGTSIYYGSQDWGVCTLKYLWAGAWSGSGIRYGRVADVP